MTIYLQSPDKTQIQAFISENQIGAGFIDWIKLTDKEITAYLLQKAKDAKIAEIRAIKETELYKPVSYMSRIFISTERASGNIVGALQIISGDVFNWIDSDGNSIIMTRTEFEGLGTAILVQRSAVYSKEAEKYLEIKNAETVEEIEAIEW